MSKIKIDVSDLAVITPEWLKQFDRGDHSPAWLSDSWLCMRGIGGRDAQFYWAEKVAEVKEQMVDDGYIFEVDKLC